MQSLFSVKQTLRNFNYTKLQVRENLVQAGGHCQSVTVNFNALRLTRLYRCHASMLFFEQNYKSILLISGRIWPFVSGSLPTKRVFNQQIIKQLHWQLVETALFGISRLNCFQLLPGVINL